MIVRETLQQRTHMADPYQPPPPPNEPDFEVITDSKGQLMLASAIFDFPCNVARNGEAVCTFYK